jgi:GrpB-like predicted nucleotidyltransferase (UPF0157 family)
MATLVEYDPAWGELFAREAERIRGALGAGALLIEHVGSTAVPGLAARPLIDTVLAVADAADEPAYLPALQAAGYVLRSRVPHRVLNRPGSDVNLCVFTRGAPEIARMVQFGDQLRACAADRERYGAGKAQDNARRDVMEAIAARALVPALRPIGLDDAAALADLYAANRDYLRPFEPRHDEAFSPRRPSASVRRRRSPMRTPTGATAT